MGTGRGEELDDAQEAAAARKSVGWQGIAHFSETQAVLEVTNGDGVLLAGRLAVFGRG